MGENEKAAPPVFETTKDTVSLFTLQSPSKKSPLQNGWFLSLIVVFVTTLACFAVYTLATMGTVGKNATIIEKDALVGRTVQFNTADVPKREEVPTYNNGATKIKLDVYINEKKVLEKSSEEQDVPPRSPFPDIVNIFKHLSNLDRRIGSSSDETKERSSETELRPRVVSSETFTIRRIPFGSNDTPFSPFHIPPLFLNPSVIFSKLNGEPIPPKKPVTVRMRPITVTSIQNSDEDIPRVWRRIRPMINIMKPKVNNSQEIDETKQKEREPFVHIVPFRFRVFRPIFRPNSVEVFDKSSNPSQESKSNEGTEFFKKFVGGSTTPKMNTEKKVATEKRNDSNEDLFKMPLFQNIFKPDWPRLEIGGNSQRTVTPLTKTEAKTSPVPSTPSYSTTTSAPVSQSFIEGTFPKKSNNLKILL